MQTANTISFEYLLFKMYEIAVLLFLLRLSSGLAAQPDALTHPVRTGMPRSRGLALNFPQIPKPDIVLGALFPVHNKNTTNFAHSCGILNVERGIHRLEAMMFAIGQINENRTLLPNITLGMSAHDTCGVYTIALEESLEFVMKSLPKTNPSDCLTSDPQLGNDQLKNDQVIAGVVGAAASSVSIQVANLLRLFGLPQISYASTTPDLSDKTKYDYFLRTVPPDNYQARAMVDVVRALNFSSVFSVNSEGIYAERGILEFITGAKAANICVSGSWKIDGGNHGSKQIDAIIEKFLKLPSVRGVVLFCTDIDVRRLLKGAKRANMTKHFIWIASDYWGTRRKPIKGLEEVAEGAITVSLEEANVESFAKYFTELKPFNHSNVNPWFNEFWELQFNCTLKTNVTTCPKLASLSQLDSLHIDDKVPFVIDAVYAFAYGLDKMYKTLCPKQDGLCQEMKTFDGSKLRDILFDVRFAGVSGNVSFDQNGNGPGRYDIFRLKSGKYTKVASWDDRLYNAQSLTDGVISRSYCPPCMAGYFKFIEDQNTCCWTCKPCQENQYVKDETSCKTCEQGFQPNAALNGCEPLPRRFIASSWIIMVMTFAGLGIVCTLFVGTIFCLNNETPVVRASGRELTYALLIGLKSCYVFSFFLLAEPSVIICAIQRLGLGFSFCICYAALLIKTNRIARIFEKSGRSTKPPNFISPASQIAILLVFVGIDIAFAGFGLAKWPPATNLAYPTKEDVVLICNIQNYDLVFALSYNIFIIVLCTIYAFRTRKTPANFNEARYIGFAMYTTCIIWVAFLPVQFGVNKDYANITLSINTTLNATTLLLCIFGPKVYILVLRPARNVRNRSLNSWRSQDTESQHTPDRAKSGSQITQTSLKSTSELGFDNLGLKSGCAKGEAAL